MSFISCRTGQWHRGLPTFIDIEVSPVRRPNILYSGWHHKLQIALVATTTLRKRSGIVAIPPLIFGRCEMRRLLDLSATDAALDFFAYHQFTNSYSSYAIRE